MLKSGRSVVGEESVIGGSVSVDTAVVGLVSGEVNAAVVVTAEVGAAVVTGTGTVDQSGCFLQTR